MNNKTSGGGGGGGGGCTCRSIRRRAQSFSHLASKLINNVKILLI